MLIDGDELIVVLNGNDVACLESPFGEDDRAGEGAHDGSAFGGGDIHAEVIIADTEMVGYETLEWGEEECGLEVGVYGSGGGVVVDIVFVLSLDIGDEGCLLVALGLVEVGEGLFSDEGGAFFLVGVGSRGEIVATQDGA